jgi:hypothetical protein
MPADRVFRRFAETLHGQLVLPGDAAYEEARAVWNAAIDRRPSAVARCADAGDVQRAVEFARAHDLEIAVRAGGHSFAGKGTCDGGLVVDCSPMRDIEVDPARHLARAAAGCTLGDLDAATQRFDLATTMGTAPPTGVAGLTLGGGLGWLMGKHGLACDNLVAADVVTADGRLLRASAEEHPELLWGLRGGGGNFGVVTRLDLRLHPLRGVYGGYVTYPPAAARQVLRRYRDWTQDAPDELTAYAGVQPLPIGPTFSVAACWSGDVDRGEAACAPMRSFAPPIEVSLGPMSYLEMQRLFDPPPFRVSAYARSGFLRALDDATIEAMVDGALATAPPALALVFVEHLHGAASRAAEAAFSHRGPAYNFATIALWTEAGAADASTAWVRGVSDAMAPFLGSGVYANYLAQGDDGRTRAAYGSAYPRLQALKRTWDPANVFRANHNVDPTAP